MVDGLTGREAQAALARIARRASARAPGLPKHARLSKAIGAEIDSGRWRAGEQLPPDTEFAKRLPFSLGTVQKALKHLEDDGVVVRRYRVGTFVRDRVMRDPDIHHLRFLFPEESGVAPLTVRTIDIRRVSEAEGWGDELDAMGRLLRIRRLCTIGADARVFLETWLPADKFAALLDIPLADMSATPLSAMLGERFDAPTLRTDHRIRLATPNAATRKWLDLPPRAAVIDWRMFCHSHDDVLIMAQRATFPQTRCALQIMEFTPAVRR